MRGVACGAIGQKCVYWRHNATPDAHLSELEERWHAGQNTADVVRVLASIVSNGQLDSVTDAAGIVRQSDRSVKENDDDLPQPQLDFYLLRRSRPRARSSSGDDSGDKATLSFFPDVRTLLASLTTRKSQMNEPQ